MVAAEAKKAKIDEENAEEQIDAQLAVSVEKLQDIQDDLEKVLIFSHPF